MEKEKPNKPSVLVDAVAKASDSKEISTNVYEVAILFNP
jgi:hypothetical protein